jgi:hypothetical protein
MRITLLLNHNNRSWIIEKMAGRLARELVLLGCEATVSENIDPSSAIVHHMSWAFANRPSAQPSTMMITHLDDHFKFMQIKTTLETNVAVGICMSNDTRQQLIQRGSPATQLVTIGPAHDGVMAPRRIVIGLTTRLYPDGRKGEHLLVGLASACDLSVFEFRIFGKGWEAIIPLLEQAGAVVDYAGETDDFQADYHTIQRAVPLFDYYLYLGMDEGSLGTLDALMAGVKTIVTPQGFHLDLPHGITHAVTTVEDLKQVFTEIACPMQQRRDGVSGLTWARYAEQHLLLWQTLLNGQPASQAPIGPPAMGEVQSRALAKLEAVRDQALSRNSFHPRRILSALSHLPALHGLRQRFDQWRHKKS